MRRMAVTAAPPRAGMVWIPGGAFDMGSEDFYPEERPVRRVSVEGFWIDSEPVTVAAFRRFVRATGHVTVRRARGRRAAGLARLPARRAGRCRWTTSGAGGPTSRARAGRGPRARAATPTRAGAIRWCTSRRRTPRPTRRGPGASLPTAAEWEYAAVGPGGADTHEHVNRWHGEFPWRGYRGTSPVGTFPANGYGLYDMVGNVWEWTADPYGAGGGCCSPGDGEERRVIKGGSHLCAPSYCHRYRPAALQGEAIDTSTSHIGFRCIVRPQ